MEKTNVLNRILAFAMAVLLLFGLVPVYEVSASAQQESGCTIEPLTEGGSVENGTVIFRDIELDYIPADNTARFEDGWWVGIKVTAPATLNMEKAVYQEQTSTGWTEAKLFKSYKASTDDASEAYIELWGLINEQYLNDAKVQSKNVHHGYRFDWDGNGTYEDQVHMEIDPTATTLKKDGKVVYPVTVGYATVEAITGGMQITGNRSDVVTALHDQIIVLEWVAADAQAGHAEDGWWLGVNVLAPANAALSDVTYQSKSSGVWSAAKSFDQDKNTENSIQLWGLLNETYLTDAVNNNKNVNYQWRFDWDGDGVYEQLVMISADPSRVVLRDSVGDQVYPNWGSVVPLTGGTVTGEQGSLTLTIEEAELEWLLADPTANRTGDGWWVGMLITAPESYTAEQLQKVTYKRRATSSVTESGWDEYQQISFAQVGDNQAQVQIWMPLTQALVDEYQQNGRNISVECVFDWNADQKDDQTVTMSVVPSERIVLKKVEQAALSFQQPHPAPCWVGEPYTNIAIGGSGNGTVTYSIVGGDGNAVIDPETGTLTFLKIGVVEVCAVKAGTDVYKETAAYYTVEAVKYAQKGFTFENSSSMITVGFDEKTFVNLATGGSGNGPITYLIKDGTNVAVVDTDTGVVTFKRAGQVTVEATKAGGDLYTDITVTYILKIEKSDQEKITVKAPASIVYSTDPQTVIRATGGSGDGQFTYTIVEGQEYADIDLQTGAITTKQANGSITVSVGKKGTEGYNDVEPVEVTIFIEKAAQKPLTFEDREPKDITFNDMGNIFKNKASGGSGHGKITYAFAEPTAAATINKTTGELTILSAGTVRVIATKAEDDCYKSQTATYVLNINRDTPEFNSADLNLIFGVEKHAIEIEEILVGTGKYVYSIGSRNEINASVNQDGEITFDVTNAVEGTVEINILKQEDDQYTSLEKTVTVTVSFLETEAKPIVSGIQKNDSGWYTDKITISAPDGYQIIYCDELNTKSWSDTLSFNTEGDNTGYVHLKNEKGITGPIAVEHLLLDVSSPAELAISYTTSAWERILETVTFGYYNPAETVVTLSAKDTVSGIAYFTVNYDARKVTADEMVAKQDGTMVYSFAVTSDYRDRISFTAVDVAGWETALKDDKVLVVDLTAPELNVMYEYTGKAREDGGVIYTNSAVDVCLEIKESNFDLSLIEEKDRPLVKLDGNAILLNWNEQGNDVWDAQVSISTPGTHTLEVTYCDLSLNEKVTYQKTIVFDETAPQITIDYSGVPVRDRIYSSSTTATITVREKNFKAEEIKLTVSAVDITGQSVDLSHMNYAAYAANPVNWTSSGDVHTLVLPEFVVDGIYTVDIAYTNLTGNPADDYVPDVITVDWTSPSNITIEYSESLVDKILDAITFGFYKSKVTVKVTAEDITSGVQSFVVKYCQNDGKNTSNKESYETDVLLPVQDAEHKNVFTASVDIDADARGTVTVYVKDNADHETQRSDDRILVLDTKVPGLGVAYDFSTGLMRENQGIYYTQGDTTVEFTIEEANFDLSRKLALIGEKEASPVVTVNGEVRTVEWYQIEGTDKWVARTVLTGNGDYVVGINYADPSGNVMQPYTQEIHIDNLLPELEVNYELAAGEHEDCYAAPHNMEVKYTEHNFKPEDVELTVIAEDITGASVDISGKEYSSKIKNPANWSKDGDIWTLDPQVMVFDIDAVYQVVLSYTDLAGNKAVTYERMFVVDQTESENFQVIYSTSVVDKILNAVTYGFYDGAMTVKIQAEDMTSGIEYFVVEYLPQSGKNNSNEDGRTSERLPATRDMNRPQQFSASYKIDPDLRGNLKIYAVDRAGNQTPHTEGKVLVLDTQVPGLTVEYDFASKQMREYQGIYYTQGNTTVKFIINEANFDLSLITAEDEAYHEAPVVTVNGEAHPVIWNQIEGTDQWVGELPLIGDGDYVVSISYADRAGHEMESYTQEIHIDNVDPVINVTYDNNDARNENCYQANRVAEVVITEHNFLPDEVELTVTAKDITGAEVDISTKEYSSKVCDPSNWTKDGDTWKLDLQTMVFDIDAIYTVTLSYTDLAENGPVVYSENFVIDKIAPSNISIDYKETVVQKVFNILGKAFTFGFYKEKVTVTVTAEDMTAGVEHVKLSYYKDENSSAVNTKSFMTPELAVTQDSEKPYVFKVSYTIPAQARGTVGADVCDRAGNRATITDERVLVVDDQVPGLTVDYDFTSKQMREYQGIYYTQGDTTVKFTIEEANFDLSLMTAADEEHNQAPVVTVNNEICSVQWNQIEGTDKWVGELPLSGNGDYVVSIRYADRVGNEMQSYTREIHIDDVAPVIAVTYNNNDARNENYYKADRTATVVITEHNFLPEEVKLTVTAKDITGKPVDISSKKYSSKACDPANWTRDGDIWTLNPEMMLFDIDAIYTVTLSYQDLAENDAEINKSEFVIDQTVSEIKEIKYSAFGKENVNGFYQSVVTVDVTAEDKTAGVEYIKVIYTKDKDSSDVNDPTYETEVRDVVQDPNHPNVFHITCRINAQARGTISAEICDRAGNVIKSDESKTIVVDDVIPERSVLYKPYKVFDAATMKEVSDYKEDDNSILYYREEAQVTFKITEANFDLSLLENAKPVIKINETQIEVDWTRNGDEYTAVYTICKDNGFGDGDYIITMTYQDPSTNQMVDYLSSPIIIDSTLPVISTQYQDGKPNVPHQERDDIKFYSTTQNLLLWVTEHNFLADDVVVSVTANDIQGNPVDVSAFDYAGYAKNRANWNHEGDVHTLDMSGMEFSMDAIYTFDISYKDILDYEAKDYECDQFVVDHAGPANLQISYSPDLNNWRAAPDTYGFYQPEVIVTVRADDMIAGVDYFEWTYNKQEGSSNQNAESYSGLIDVVDITSSNKLDMITYSNDGLTATASFKIPAQTRGHISLVAVDRAGNASQIADTNRINVVDNIAPEVSVSYKPTEQTTATQYVDTGYGTVESFDQAANAYYNGSVTATIRIEEANFFEGVEAVDGIIHRVGILVTRTDDNDEVTYTEYLPQGAKQRHAEAQPQQITWVTEGDVHTAQITLAADGDYILDIDYTDFSENPAVIKADDGKSAVGHYVSKILTVDCTAPVVTVAYGNQNITHTIDGRDYFAAAQSAVITVVEHNFRPTDFAASFVAEDILGQTVATENFTDTLSNAKNWKSNGNVHTARIFYSVDANYTFDCTMQDLAQNVSADYEEDLFTVDTTAPENLTVSYSTSILEKVLQSITFGYYNAQMKVTITADDDVAGVLYFVYSYIKGEGVSGVNAQLLNEKLEEANNSVVRNGKTSTTSFMIPKNLLKGDNQFNGTVSFTAYDRSENSTLREDNYRIVVDNIKPTATITYNAPSQNANNISYYMGNINAQIKINEANFYKEDVVVKVNGQPVSVHWVDNSADLHTGTFSITNDGNYVVTVSYKDRSNNEMTTYTSNTLTIDTVAPSVEVSNIKNDSANKDEKYSFTITATDINMDPSTFKPALTATVRNEDGTYGTKTVSLGNMKTVEKGKVYSFTVEDLPEDAVYLLKCTVRDMSGNQYDKLILSNNEVYDQVRFSINRNGSTFMADQNTNELIQQYYVYSVNSNVVLEEINVDPVENYTVRLNGQELTEGEDYTTSVTHNDGEWSKRTYVIAKSLFEAEGEYSVVVETKDKAETTAFSDVKNLNVSFVVDQTPPVLTISGLQDGGRYQVDEQKVTVIPTDDGGRLYSMKVTALDSEGQPLKDANGRDISVRFEMSGEEFLSHLIETKGEITFTVPEGLEHQVVITCSDCAVNDSDEVNVYHRTFNKVTVSQSGWIIFYANKPLFYSTVAGVAVTLGLLIFLIVFKRRKKEAK